MRLLLLAAAMLAVSCGANTPPSTQPTQPTQPVTPSAQQPPGVQGTAELAEAMGKLSFMRGVWAGPAKGMDREGRPYSVTQTERVGPMLGGDILVIEGRGYQDDNSTGFNAFAVVSWNPKTQKYEMRSYAMGHAGTFELKLTGDGYTWEIPAGPDAVIRFTATIKDDQWREVGEYVAPGKPSMQTFEMNLKRVADTDWPLGTPVSPSVGR